MGRNTVEIWATAPLPYLTIPVNALRLENTLLVICKVLGLFVNPLTSDYKYSLLKTENLLQHFQRQLSKKRKIFSEFFFFSFLHFLNLYSNLNIFKKRWPSQLMHLWTEGLRKTWFGKCLKSSVSEDSFTSNIANGPKHCWNLNDRTFTIFIDPQEGYSASKRLSEGYAKS